jgi:hypothetical protein
MKSRKNDVVENLDSNKSRTCLGTTTTTKTREEEETKKKTTTIKQQEEKTTTKKREWKNDFNDNGSNKRPKEEEEDTPTIDDLEEFEVNASDLVTKTEAKTVYCLPEGTLAVCDYVEKENPRHKGWTPMKMYRRSEIRKWARERFEGLEGLIAERTKRSDRRLAKDMEQAREIFEN